ncbi:MAG: spore coat protein U domain-containing protein [Vicinamibacteria bacterium]|nr:spore coat protein U domain-containing protein [Vicinamibacteria bacterium]
MWGDGTGGTTTYFENNPPNNKDVVLTVYGRITAGQDVGVGSYTDTVVVTLEY